VRKIPHTWDTASNWTESGEISATIRAPLSTSIRAPVIQSEPIQYDRYMEYWSAL